MDWMQGIGVLFMAGGVACTFAMARANLRHRAILRNPMRTKGTIISLKQAPGSGEDGGPDWYIPRVRYRARDGGTYERDLSAVLETKRYRVGHEISVLYQRTNPTNVTSANDKNTQTVSLVAVLLFSLFLIGMGAMLTFGSIPAQN